MPPPGLLSTCIATSKDGARASMEANITRGDFSVYRDGLGYEGGVGVAVVAERGASTECTVHDALLTALSPAIYTPFTAPSCIKPSLMKLSSYCSA
jgi:hypothetical protein